MSSPLDFSKILSAKKKKLFADFHQWHWVSTLTKPDIKPAQRPPEFLEYASLMHSPPHRELFLSLSGSVLFTLGEQVYQIEPGTVLMFNRRETHNLKRAPWNSNKSFCHLWLHISNPHVISSNINECFINKKSKNTPLKLISGYRPRLLMKLWDQCETAFSPIHWTFLKSVITTCFFEAVSDWQYQKNIHPHEIIVHSVCEYIHQNLDKELTLELLSDFAGYSAYFFHRMFRRYTGKPLRSYIIDAKLERAKELLILGQTVSAVSEEIGMPSPSYFSRFFKKYTHSTPSYWSRVHQVQKWGE